MSLISRYVFREAFWSLLVVMSVLFVIFMSNQFAEILGDAAADVLPKEVVFAVFGLTSLRYLMILAPIALFLGIMLALARLNRDAEMSALLACGIGPVQLLRPIGVLTGLLAILAAWLALYATPDASLRIEQIKHEAETELDIGVMESGRFATPDSGGSVFYAERVEGEQLHDVFWEREIDGRIVVILAERGERVHEAETGKLSFVLYNGTRYEGVPGGLNFSMVEFVQHGIPIRDEVEEEFVASPEMKSTAALLESADLIDRTELQWRLSSPLSLFVLALLAIPLSRSKPREGRYARLGLGLMVYIIYANSLAVARIWVERGEVPSWLGIWWVHACVGLLALTLFAHQAGWWALRRSAAVPRPV